MVVGLQRELENERELKVPGASEAQRHDLARICACAGACGMRRGELRETEMSGRRREGEHCGHNQ